MSIYDSKPRKTYAVGATAQAAFAVPFVFWKASDLRVYVDDALLTGGYTVTGGDGAGGTVTLAAPVSNTAVAIVRRLRIERTTDFPAAGALKTAALNRQLDQNTAILQQLDDDNGRALTLPENEDAAGAPLPSLAQRANRVLGFDAAGKPIVSTISVQQLDALTLAALQAGKVAEVIEPFEADGTTSTITTTAPLVAAAQVTLLIGGIIQRPESGAYTVSGTTITLAEPPPAGVVVGGFVGYATEVAGAALTAIQGTTPAADRLPYFTGEAQASTTALTAFARSLLGGADAATIRALLGTLATNGDGSNVVVTPTGGGSQRTLGNVTTNLAADGSVQATDEKGFWTDAPGGAMLHRLRDRLLIGDAVVQDGKAVPTVRSWAGQSANGYMTYFDSHSAFEAITPKGGIAGAFASRTSDTAEAGSDDTIGVASYVKNDDTGSSKTAWAYYGHAAREAGAGTTICMEVDIANVGATVAANPYLMGVDGMTAAHWVGVGGETAQSGTTVNPASLAVGIITSAPEQAGAKFAKGVVFQSGALTSDGVAIELPRTYKIQWVYDGSSNVGGSITSEATDQGARQVFTSSGVDLRDSAGTTRLTARTDGSLGVNLLGNAPAAALEVLAGGTTRPRSATTYPGALVQNGAGNVALTLASYSSAGGGLFFADESAGAAGGLTYDHATDSMTLRANNVEVLKLDAGKNVFLDGAKIFAANRVNIKPSFTLATLPSAAAYGQGEIYVSDLTGGGEMCFSDGANWRRYSDRSIAS